MTINLMPPAVNQRRQILVALLAGVTGGVSADVLFRLLGA